MKDNRCARTSDEKRRQGIESKTVGAGLPWPETISMKNIIHLEISVFTQCSRRNIEKDQGVNLN